MKLREVKICGFRSIENMELSFEENGHKVLVGKNESGKSNILKAFGLLSSDTNFQLQDKKELYENNPFVRFVFYLEMEEITKIKEAFSKKFSNIDSDLTMDSNTVMDFISTYSKSIMYKITNDEKFWTKWELSKDLKIKAEWYRLHESFPLDQFSDIKNKLNDISYIHCPESFFTDTEYEQVKDYLSLCKGEEIYEELFEIIENTITSDGDSVFSVLNWRYSSKEHDLPTHVDRDVFLNDPDTCIPLKNMFF